MSNAMSDKARANVKAIQDAMAYAKGQDAQRPIADANARAYRNISDGMPFRPVVFNLSELTLAGSANATPRYVGFSGSKLVYRREGSHPGGRLLLRAGGDLRQLYPGCVVTGPFTGREEVFLDTNSAPAGQVSLEMVGGEPGRFNFEEPQVDVQQSIPSVLLGSVNGVAPDLVKTYVPVAPATLPTGTQDALPAGAFCITGTSMLRVEIVLTGGVKEFTLVPYFSEGDGVWYDNSSQAYLVPDSAPSAQANRVLLMPVTGNGYLYFYIVEGSVAGGYTFIVEAVR